MVSVGSKYSPGLHHQDNITSQNIKKAVSDLKGFSHELYHRFSSDFLEPSFSHKLANTLSKDISSLDESTLLGVHRVLHGSGNRDYSHLSPDFTLDAKEAGIFEVPKRGRNNSNLRFLKERIQDKMNELNQSREEVIFTDQEVLSDIIRQIIVRGNIIGSINKIIDESGNGLVQERLNQLLNGSLCLSPQTNPRLQNIASLLQARSSQECKSLNGIPTPISILQEIKKDNRYWNFANRIAQSYQSNIQELKSIRQTLVDLKPMSSQELGQISFIARNILDELYIETELYYLICALALIETK